MNKTLICQKELDKLKKEHAFGKQFYKEVGDRLGEVIYGYGDLEGEKVGLWAMHCPESLLDMSVAILKENPEIIEEYQRKAFKC